VITGHALVLALCVALVVWWIVVVDAVEIRNRMRSVDDLMYYGTWKRETLKAQRRNDDKTDRRCVDGGSASLNQSYSGASTLTATAATDDEGRHGPTQRRRRTLRLRRRPAGGLNSSISSIVSAPTATRQFNLDESAGSGALDVDSMFRFFASSTQTPVADDAVCSRTVKTRGLPPPGLPPSGRTTSVRRTSVRRRRRPNSSMTDVTNGFTDTASSSFDGVKMTSSSADLKDATATTVMSAVTQPESCSVERSRPVRRSLRRRRRTSESPSGTGAQDLTDVEAQAHVTPNSAASSDVIEPEALWELCGEKLNELCRRILGTGVAVTDYVVTGVAPQENITEPAHTEVKVVQPSVVDKSPPYNEVASESRRTTGVFHSVDLSAYRVSLIPDVIPDLDQPSQSLDRTAGAVEKKVTDVDGSVISHVDDDDYSREPTSLAVAEGDVHRRDGVETADGHVPPQDGERYVKQFQTATYSPEQWRVQLELEEAMVSDQLRTDQTPPMIGENHADVVDDDQLSDDGASNIVEERRGSPREDISAMLAPSIDLQDILDTIYTLTGGVSGENSMTDEDATPSLSTHGLPPNSLVSGIKTCVNQEGVDASQKLPDDVHLAEQSAAVCLDRADDDDESSLDLDVEMYDYDLSPAAGDLADSVHLAIAEDDDDIDLDIADYEYDLDDDVL